MARNQWQRIADRNIAKLTLVAIKSAIASESSVMFKSPVRDGMFKNNWYTEVNGISGKTTFEVDRSGAARLADAYRLSMTIKIGDTISFVNNLPYNIRLEYGYSDQAPGGMVRLTAAQWPLIVKDVVRGMR